MDDKDFTSLVYVNAKGIRTVLADKAVKTHFEIKGRSGFTAPDVQLITQTYFDGTVKILKRQLQPRTVIINMMVTGKTEYQRDALFFQMINQLMDVSGGEVGRLYVKRSDGSTVYLNCAYQAGLNVTEDYRRFQQFALEFYAADPYFYRDLEIVPITLPPEAKITLRDRLLLGDGHVLGETSGEGYGIVKNNGYESILPVIKAKRINGSFRITNNTTGQTLALNNIVTEVDQTLVIDIRGETKSIKIVNSDGSWITAGQYLDWSNINMEFEIVSGENEITFSAGTGSYTEGIEIELSERFLSA